MIRHSIRTIHRSSGFWTIWSTLCMRKTGDKMATGQWRQEFFFFFQTYFSSGFRCLFSNSFSLIGSPYLSLSFSFSYFDSFLIFIFIFSCLNFMHAIFLEYHLKFCGASFCNEYFDYTPFSPHLFINGLKRVNRRKSKPKKKFI